MVDTAQPVAAAETDPIAQTADAADAFKAFLDPQAERPRNERGQFTSATDEPEELPEEAEEPETDEVEGDEAEAELEADEEAPEAHPMPPSWGADDAELWATLPPEAQARIAAREGERDRGLNLKLQETANARKAAEAKAVEVSTRLEELDRVIGTVEAIYKTPEPDPRAFGYGTQQFNQAAYNTAYQQWQQTEQALAQLNEQRAQALSQQEKQEAEAFNAWKQEHEATYAPKFIADVPDLTDPAKGGPILQGLIEYGKANGISEDVFSDEAVSRLTSAELHILWKAQQFDKVRANKGVAPKPKPAGPVVKPGVSSPRSATKAARHKRDFDRLEREGSIAAGAAVFKNLF